MCRVKQVPHTADREIHGMLKHAGLFPQRDRLLLCENDRHMYEERSP